MRTRLRRSLRTRLALLASIAMLLLNTVVSAFVLYGIRDEVSDVRALDASRKALHVLLMVKRNQLPRILDPSGLDGMQVVDPAGRAASWTPSLAGMPRQTTALPHPSQAN